MFAGKNRIKKDREFRKIFRFGEKKKGNFFDLYLLDNKFGINRYGIVVSNKVARKATARNRLKRIIREALKKHKAGQGIDLVVVVKKKPEKNQKIISEALKKML